MRTHTDGYGTVSIPDDAPWGKQTQRSLDHFQVGPRLGWPLVRCQILIKQAAAQANAQLGVITPAQAELIDHACTQLLADAPTDFFPLKVYQTGSGTQTNMNVNEVIAGLAQQHTGGQLTDTPWALHPNDHVNASQSSNDTISAALMVCTYEGAADLLAAVTLMRDALTAKAESWHDIVKIGRTHLMDAVPLTLGSEAHTWAAELTHRLTRLQAARTALLSLPLGGTVHGSGQNAPQGFSATACQHLAQLTGSPYTAAPRPALHIANHSVVADYVSELAGLARVTEKITQDIRLLGSGPRCGLGELQLPALEPGSSIMPGKVNPTQCEALLQVCWRVEGLATTASRCVTAGSTLQLNVAAPLLGHIVMEAHELLAGGLRQFTTKCINDLTANRPQIETHRQNSLMLVTALVPHIGYDAATAIAQHAHQQGVTLPHAAEALGHCTADQATTWINHSCQALHP